MGLGETKTIPVDVHNWSDEEQSGTVALALPANFTADAASKPYGPLAPGADATVEFEVTSTDTALPATADVPIPITTTYAGGSGSETLTVSLVPTTSIPQASAAPTVDGQEGAGEYGGPALDVGKRWEGTRVRPGRRRLRDVRHAGRPGDQHVREGHVAGRRPVLLRPRPRRLPELRGQAGGVRRPLARGLGRVPDRPARHRVRVEHGHGVHVQARGVPVHERPDRQQRQRAERALLGARRRQPPGLLDRAARRHGERRAERARRGGRVQRDLGRHERDDDRPRVRGRRLRPRGQDPDGGSPRGRRPRAHRAQHHAVRQRQQRRARARRRSATSTPGQTRLAWSAFGSVQSDPWRWGHASVAGYTPPADRPTTPEPPNVSSPNLNGVDSPQTIAQSARNGVPISGRDPAPRENQIRNVDVDLTRERGDAAVPHERDRPGARVPVVREQGLHPGLGDELRALGRPAAGLRDDRLRARRRHGPAVVAGHERPRRPRPGRAAPAAVRRR